MTSFEDVYRVDGPRLVGEICAITGSLPEAEDVVQEAFVRAFSRWSLVGALEAPDAWVRRVALNLATSRWRSARRRAKLAARLVANPPPEQNPAVPVDTVELITVLRNLSQKQRVAVVLHYWADLPVAEIADVMHLPESTVKSHLRRGRKRLATLIAFDASDDSLELTS